MCNCPGATFAGHWGECKHAAMARERWDRYDSPEGKARHAAAIHAPYKPSSLTERVPLPCNCIDGVSLCYYPDCISNEALKEHNDMTQTGMALEPVRVNLPARRIADAEEIEALEKIATIAMGAGTDLLPKNIKTKEQAIAVMLTGHELGVPPFTSLRHLYIVNGRAEPDAQAMMGIVMALDPTARWVWHEYRRDLVDVELQRGGQKVFRCDYTLEDAKASGQFDVTLKPKVKTWKQVTRRDGSTGNVPDTYERNADGSIVQEAVKGPWQQYTRDMLAYNAVRRCCRFGAPDLINVIDSRGRAAPAEPRQLPAATEDAVRLGLKSAAKEVEESPLGRAIAAGEVQPLDVFEPDAADLDRPGTIEGEATWADEQDEVEQGEPPESVGKSQDDGRSDAPVDTALAPSEPAQAAPPTHEDPGPAEAAFGEAVAEPVPASPQPELFNEGKAPVEVLRMRIFDKLRALQSATEPALLKPFLRRLNDTFTPGAPAFQRAQVAELTEEQAVRCLAMIAEWEGPDAQPGPSTPPTPA